MKVREFQCQIMCSLDGQLLFDGCRIWQYGRNVHVFVFSGNYVAEIIVEVS